MLLANVPQVAQVLRRTERHFTRHITRHIMRHINIPRQVRRHRAHRLAHRVHLGETVVARAPVTNNTAPVARQLVVTGAHAARAARKRVPEQLAPRTAEPGGGWQVKDVPRHATGHHQRLGELEERATRRAQGRQVRQTQERGQNVPCHVLRQPNPA